MKQTIEEAANGYLQKILEASDFEINFEEDNYDAGARDAVLDVTERAFKAGAEWSINSIWHDNTNIPDDNKFCMFTLSDGNCGCGYYHKKDNTIWYENFSDVVRWAYFEDITPNMEN